LDLLIDCTQEHCDSSTLRGEHWQPWPWASLLFLDRVRWAFIGEKLIVIAIAVKHKIDKYIPDFLKDKKNRGYFLVGRAKAIYALPKIEALQCPIGKLS